MEQTYRWMSGQIFLGGGLDVEVTASSPEEARTKVAEALKSFRVCLSESQTVEGVRFAYAFENNEAILGAPSEPSGALVVGGKVRLLRDSLGTDEHDHERRVVAGTVGVIALVERLPPPQGLSAHVDFHNGVTLVLDESDCDDWQVIA
jgi:hypothetical protein